MIEVGSDAKPVQTAVELKIGEKEYTVNGQELQADVAPQIIDGRTMVPLRFVAEAFGADIDWGPEEGQTEWVNIHC